MQGLDYWINTFVSNPMEGVVLVATLGVLFLSGWLYSDEWDKLAVIIGTLLLAGVLAGLGPRYIGEWQYWLGGGVVAVIAILTIDFRWK